MQWVVRQVSELSIAHPTGLGHTGKASHWKLYTHSLTTHAIFNFIQIEFT